MNAFVTSIDWQTISDIGQAVGALGTVISALALVGVVHSLRLQHRQARASEEEVVRGMRNDLMLVALENEEYLPLWGFPHALSNREMTLHAYLGMEFSYFETALRHGRMTELELERMLARMFQISTVRDFWRESRIVYLESGDQSAGSLARIAERHYRNVVEYAEIESSSSEPATAGDGHRWQFDTLDVAGLLPPRPRRAVLSTCLQLLRVAIWLAVGATVRRGRYRSARRR
ncbi:hypothetical protein JCM9534A_60420 [Catenuloplanes indicus JCM 9534]